MQSKRCWRICLHHRLCRGLHLEQEELRVLRGFFDEAVYVLSDSAKAFAIILFTDIFVIFHSPEGWTVLLDGIANHLDPARENFIFALYRHVPGDPGKPSSNTGFSAISTV